MKKNPPDKKLDKQRLKAEKINEIRTEFLFIEPHFNERSKRLFAATKALTIGKKGISWVHEATGISRVTITAGCKELLEAPSMGKIR